MQNFLPKHSIDRRSLHGKKERLEKFFYASLWITNETIKAFPGQAMGPARLCLTRQWAMLLRRQDWPLSAAQSPAPTGAAPVVLCTSVTANKPALFKSVEFVFNLPPQLLSTQIFHSLVYWTIKHCTKSNSVTCNNPRIPLSRKSSEDGRSIIHARLIVFAFL